MVGAAHAHDVAGHRHRQTVRHAAALTLQFAGVEIDPEAGTAGAATEAGLGTLMRRECIEAAAPQ